MGLCLVVGLAVAFGALYSALSLRHYRALAYVPGEVCDVDGYAMHMYCSGQGASAIVLDTGLGDDFTIRAKVQPALSKTTRVCLFDSSGFGWSQLRPGVRDAGTMARELNRLVAKAGIDKPFVLMGHSFPGSRFAPIRSAIPPTWRAWSLWMAPFRSRTTAFPRPFCASRKPSGRRCRGRNS